MIHKVVILQTLIMSAYGAPVSQSTGIQQLLAAEKRAAEKVSAARKRKAQRLKQAKEEAQAEIDAYRQERERQYREHEARILGSKGDMEARIEENTRMKMKEINKSVGDTKEIAMSRLLSIICDINPELHQNFTP